MATTPQAVTPVTLGLDPEFPALKQGYPGPPDDGLCHAYREYEGLDCLQPIGHAHGPHGDPAPERVRTGARC